MPVKLGSDDEPVTDDKTNNGSDDEIVTVKRNKTSRIESDKSGTEENGSLPESTPNNDSGDEFIFVKGGKRHRNFLESDDEESTSCLNEEMAVNIQGAGDDEEGQNCRHSNVVPTKENKNLSNDYTHPPSPKILGDITKDYKLIFSNKDLYDPEDSEDDLSNNCPNTAKLEIKNCYDAEGSSDENSERKESMKRKTKISKAKNKTKSIEKKNVVDEIHSETQRLIRRSRVSLPYHKPKQHTLAEFLQRRPTISTKSLRMSSVELKVMAEEVRKRVKEAEEFYKSSSDEDKSETLSKSRDTNVSNPHVCKGETANVCHETNKGDGISETIVNEEYCVIVNENIEKSDNQGDSTVDLDGNRNNAQEEFTTFSRAKGFDVSSDTNSQNLQLRISTSNCDTSLDDEKFGDTHNKCSVDSGTTKAAKTIPHAERQITFNDEDLDSQDLCLRIEDSETFGADLEKNDRAVSKINTSQAGTLLKDNEISKTPLNQCIDEISSQSLCLKIDNSESFDHSKSAQGGKLLAEEASEIIPSIMFTKDYEKFSLRKGKMNFEEPSVETKIDSTNVINLNSSICNSTREKGYGNSNDSLPCSVLQECLPDINNLEYSHLKSIRSIETSVTSFHLSETNSSENPGLINVNKDCEYELIKDGTTKYSSEHKSSDHTSLQKNVNEDVESNYQEVKSSASEISLVTERNNIIKDSEHLKLILEGEETRVAFDHDENTLLNGKVTAKETQKCKELNISDLEVNGNVGIESIEEKSSVFERKRELSSRSCDILALNDSSIVSQEKALKAINELKGGNEDEKKNSKLLRKLSLLEERLKSTRKSLKLQKTVPQLKGSPNKVIDLDDTPSSCEISILKQRFLRHSFPNIPAPKKQNVEISVVSLDKGPLGEVEIKKDVVPLSSEKDNLLESRAQLLKFKEQLQRQIAKEKEEEWNKRLMELKNNNTSDKMSNCGNSDFDDEDEILESDISDSENCEEEEEEEEEVTEGCEKPRRVKKCAYVDDEAEVSEDSEKSNSEYEDLITEPLEHSGTNTEVFKEEERNEDVVVPDLRRIKTLDPFESQDVLKRIGDSSLSLNTDGDIELESSLSIPPYQLGAVSQPDSIAEESFLNVLPPTMPTPFEKKEENNENVFSQFPQSSSPFGTLSLRNSQNDVDEDEAELLGLCSGKFASQLPELTPSISEPAPTLEHALLPENERYPKKPVEDSDNIKLSYENTFQSKRIFQYKESCTEDSNTNSSFEESNTKAKEKQLPQKRKYILLSSDDEEEEQKPHQKGHKQLQFSDDEDEGSVFDKDKEAFEVEYDSEENEILVPRTAAKDFFENEAELSESEWGSADEDEKDLDDLEMEEGDDEKFDENKVKEQLDKIHLRRVLDDDQHEIKRLQELLLEDGEFHSEGGGRQRQFRWKNLNNVEDLLASTETNDDDPSDEEEEDESEWRRMRFERELFLQEHKKNLEKDDLLNALKVKFKSPSIIPRKGGQVKRGSFLTRSEETLARIAQMTKNSTEVNLSAPTNSRNFVFVTLSQDPKENDKIGKRKASKAEAPAAKKIRVRESVLDHLG